MATAAIQAEAAACKHVVSGSNPHVYYQRRSWIPVSNMDWHGLGCLVAMFLQAVLEISLSLVTSAFRKTGEKPVVTCLTTAKNMDFLQAMPSLKTFCPTWWALGPFAQTVIHGSRVVANATPYCREFIHMRDDVAVALDWKVVDPQPPPDAPLIVVCHGLGGNSMTNSCNGVTEALARRGWRVVVYNRRGHGGTSLLPSPRKQPTIVPQDESNPEKGSVPSRPPTPLVKAFPAHVDLEDLEVVVGHIQTKFPAAPKALVGLSAGSNLVLRFQGDCAQTSPFRVAVSVSNGHELTHLTKTLLDKPLTDLMLVTFLKEVLYDRFHEVQALVHAAGLKMDWRKLLSRRRTRDFEALLSAPVWGFQDVDDYYIANSCFQSFKNVRVPLLSLANGDDPVIDKDLIKYAQDAARENENVISVATTRGGHLGWLHGSTAQPWMHLVVVEFLSAAFQAGGGDA